MGGGCGAQAVGRLPVRRRSYSPPTETRPHAPRARAARPPLHPPQACGAGRRAARAAELLEAAGFGDLKVYRAGWTAWLAEGRPVEK